MAEYAKTPVSKAAKKRYKQLHAEEWKKINQAWLETETGKISRRRSQSLRWGKLNRGTYKIKDLAILFQEFGNRCAYCGEDWTSIDHVVPISKGGLDIIANLVPCCAHCNPSKSNKTVEEWYPGQDFFTDDRWQLLLQKIKRIISPVER